MFIVMGTAGEYSDRREWPVAAYIREEDARRHIVLADRWSKNLRARLQEHDIEDEYYLWSGSGAEQHAEFSNPFDPDQEKQSYAMDTEYFMYSVPVNGKHISFALSNADEADTILSEVNNGVEIEQ